MVDVKFASLPAWRKGRKRKKGRQFAPPPLAGWLSLCFCGGGRKERSGWARARPREQAALRSEECLFPGEEGRERDLYIISDF